MKARHQLLLIGAISTGILSARGFAQTPVGNEITYQGVLNDGADVANGTYDVRFRLMDAATAGGQVGTILTMDDVSIVDGLVTANLNFGSSTVGQNARWLEIAVRPGASAGAFTTLAPRQRLNAAPFAIQSLNDANWSKSGANILNTNTGNVGIGTASPLGRLHIANTTDPDLYVENTGDTSASRRTSLNFRHSAGVGAEIEAQRETGNADGMYLAFKTEPVGGALAEQMRITDSGDVAIGLTGPSARLHVKAFGDEDNVAPPSFRAASEYPLQAGGTSTEYIQFDGTHIFAQKDGADTRLKMQQSGGHVAIGTNLVGINDPKLVVSRNAALLADSNLAFEDVMIHDSGNAWLGLYSDTLGNVGSGITLCEYGPTQWKWGMYARTTDNVGDLVITFGADANPTSNEKMLQIDRDGTTKVKVLEILGADVSERFPISHCVQPGDVVMIDSANPGQLCLATGEYNTKVAGIVSGAGDIPVGAILGNMKGIEDAPPIALSGRVWTNCDATHGAIEPGDLLTTSETAGHAMKAADADRRGGAMIGKAMTSLAEGEKGLVLVLANLQ